jgi:hypothetical protein
MAVLPLLKRTPECNFSIYQVNLRSNLHRQNPNLCSCQISLAKLNLNPEVAFLQTVTYKKNDCADLEAFRQPSSYIDCDSHDKKI